MALTPEQKAKQKEWHKRKLAEDPDYQRKRGKQSREAHGLSDGGNKTPDSAGLSAPESGSRQWAAWKKLRRSISMCGKASDLWMLRNRPWIRAYSFRQSNGSVVRNNKSKFKRRNETSSQPTPTHQS